MKIKNLLLSSAAALVASATSQMAQAADAILVEPEPVEYVRICDAYGAGFFYIPGTETCLKLGGNVRSTFRHISLEVGGVDQNEVGTWNYRGRFNFDARNETDWGTLRSYLQLEGTGGGVEIETLEISVAGFRLGVGGSYWTGAHDDSGGPEIDAGWYGDIVNKYFDYTWANDGFSLTVGVSDDAAGADDTPDYYIGGRYEAEWGNVAATYVYDQDATTASGSMGAGAWKVSGALNDLGGSGWNLFALYAADGDDMTSYIPSEGALSAAGSTAVTAQTDYIWRVGINGMLADDLTGYTYYSAADSDDRTAKGVGVGFNEAHQWAVGLVWEPISGLAIQTEYMAGEADFGTDTSADEDWDRFTVRVTRSW